MRSNKRLSKLLIVFLIIVIAVCVYIVSGAVVAKSSSDAETSKINKILVESNHDEQNQQYNRENKTKEKKDRVPFTKTAFQKLKEVNSDLIGYIEFNSGIVSQPIVQSSEVDFYMRRSFYKQHNDQGTIFLDENMTLEDTNFVLYGHNVYYDASAMFSPVSKLVNQQYYENNKYFKIYTDSKVKEFEITNVYYVDESEGYIYQENTFLYEDEFNEWMKIPNERNLILPTEHIHFGDKFATLQTCKAWKSTERIIVLAKLMNEYDY